MCTSLLYFDQNAAPYAGRTLELPVEQPYQVVYHPTGSKFSSTAEGHAPLHYQAKHGFLAVAIANGSDDDLKVVEGLNSEGLTYSLLAFATASGPKDNYNPDTPVLAVIDLGNWLLSQFATVAEVKAALVTQPILVTGLGILGTDNSPFHYAIHDATGASLVIEYHNGEQSIYDNPVGVLTNGPEFSWHLTNLRNYTHLSNIDQSKLTLNGQRLLQPDSGIATASLPASNTSVGRFVRAAYYANFTEKAADPHSAIVALAHIMNNFDRPRGITVDPVADLSRMDAGAPEVAAMPGYCSEYTSWTSLSDLRQGILHIRTYTQLNYVRINLSDLLSHTHRIVVPLAKLNTQGIDATPLFQQAV